MFEIPSRPDWMLLASCRTLTPDEIGRFFPTSGGSAMSAREYCDECAVRVECADYAIENRVHHGVWGGLSERDRRRLRVEQATTSRNQERRAS